MKIKITTDLVISMGLCVALFISLIKGVSAEIITCIVGNLGGYMGRSLMNEHLERTTATLTAKNSAVDSKEVKSNATSKGN